MGIILDGKALAHIIEGQLAACVNDLKTRIRGKVPILATVLVGDNPASATYVRMKGNACQRVGMESLKVMLPRDVIDRWAAYTPVPGGVGPMTIATVMEQTVQAAEKNVAETRQQ